MKNTFPNNADLGATARKVMNYFEGRKDVEVNFYYVRFEYWTQATGKDLEFLKEIGYKEGKTWDEDRGWLYDYSIN